MNALNLKKGDMVFGGVVFDWKTDMGDVKKFEVRSIIPSEISGGRTKLRIRLCFAGMVVYDTSLFDGCIYATEEDFRDGNRIDTIITWRDIYYKMARTFGLTMDSCGKPLVWIWDADEKRAIAKTWSEGYNLADLRLPEGSYASKEECEKANRKTIKVEVIRKQRHVVEVEADTFEEAEDWVADHIDELDDAYDSDYVVNEVAD